MPQRPGPGDEDHALVGVGELLEDGGQAQFVDGADLGREMAEHGVPAPALAVGVVAEALPVGEGVGAVHFPLLLQAGKGGGVQDLENQGLAVRGEEGPFGDGQKPSQLPDANGGFRGDVKVGTLLVDAGLQVSVDIGHVLFFEVEWRLSRALW